MMLLGLSKSPVNRGLLHVGRDRGQRTISQMMIAITMIAASPCFQ